MHIVIRRYQTSDKDAVQTLFRDGIQEHINPSFIGAITQPLFVAVTLCLCVTGYILGGQSFPLALLAGGLWVALVYYSCYELYAGFVRIKLQTDMQDIPGYYLSSPDNCFWVAEAEIDGRSQIVGMVAVEAKTEESGDGKRYGELFRMIVSSACRRCGLGARLAKTAVDFCKEHGFSKVVLETSSTQRAAVVLYRKLGFTLTLVHTETYTPRWLTWLTGVTILKMEKDL
ncbi:N-acetyltransferase 8-like 2 [Chanos chanos]|uniref:N-acetyltransferase 8-like 2 n=1 Tax=Chanos chanos TaxID=29144 RepID=A0A6J2VR34_CHACN|nr:probable N-acetyltransferase camello [Chanos chanos]